ncbi:polysaccharide lyase [Zoogloea sp.]|uniref:polysaccharide lyase n=1 Tax=Zoogloea sp. TaxID=49181 RepID=UPI0035B0596F
MRPHRFLFLFIILFFGGRSLDTQAAERVAVYLNFDKPSDFFSVGRLLLRDDVEFVEQRGFGGSAGIKVTYIGNSKGSPRVVQRIPFSDLGVEHALLRYQVKFCHDFDFARGGKLHGLAPNSLVSGGRSSFSDGWSARLVFTPGGGLASYVYHYGQNGRFGDHRQAKDFRFELDRWYQLELDLKLNDLGASNGRAVIRVNGNDVVDHKGLTFRRDLRGDLLISQLLFSTFFGGNDSSFAPRGVDGQYKNVCAIFDDFEVLVY